MASKPTTPSYWPACDAALLLGHQYLHHLNYVTDRIFPFVALQCAGSEPDSLTLAHVHVDSHQLQTGDRAQGAKFNCTDLCRASAWGRLPCLPIGHQQHGVECAADPQDTICTPGGACMVAQ